jgi:hypothetical protein
MSIGEATVSNMWEIAAIVEVLERKGFCMKHDRYDLITEFQPCVPDTPVLRPRGITAANHHERNGRG